MAYEFPEDQNKKNCIDPDSETYKALYAEGSRQEKDEIDTLIIELLAEVHAVNTELDDVSVEEIMELINHVLKEKKVTPEIVQKVYERIDLEYAAVLAGGEPYGDEKVDDYALDGDDVEEAHRHLENAQKEAVILKGKLGLTSNFSYELFSDTRRALKRMMESVEEEKGFSVNIVDDKKFFAISFVDLESIQEKIGIDIVLALVNGTLDVAEISLLDSDQLEAITFFLTTLRAGVEKNEIPEGLAKEITFSSIEERNVVVKRIIDQRELVNEQLRVAESINFDELFLKDETDLFLKELFENPGVARLQLVEKSREELIVIIKKLNAYEHALRVDSEVSVEKRKEVLLFFYPHISDFEEGDQVDKFEKVEAKFVAACSMISRVAHSLIKEAK